MRTVRTALFDWHTVRAPRLEISLELLIGISACSGNLQIAGIKQRAPSSGSIAMGLMLGPVVGAAHA